MPVNQVDDKVWFNNERKLSAICNEARSNAAQGQNVLVLSHFPTALFRLTQLLRAASIQSREFSTYDSPQLCKGHGGTVWTGLTRAFQPSSSIESSTGESIDLKILVVEHDPRRSEDQGLLDAANTISCSAELCFHFSLDDPLLLHFNGDSLQKLFKTIGIDESESLSHHLITTAIRTAQEKIESQVMRDLQAESIEDWFKYNLP